MCRATEKLNGKVAVGNSIHAVCSWRIEIERANSAAGIAKTLSDTELNKAKKILAQKGMIRADLEGEASGVVQKMIRFMKESVTKPNAPRKESFDDLFQP